MQCELILYNLNFRVRGEDRMDLVGGREMAADVPCFVMKVGLHSAFYIAAEFPIRERWKGIYTSR